MPTPELSEHLWTGKGLVGLVRKGNLPGGGFQYKSGARESFVETKVSNSPAVEPLASLRLTLDRAYAFRRCQTATSGDVRALANPQEAATGEPSSRKAFSMRSSDWQLIDEARGSASRGLYLSACPHRWLNAQQNGCSPAV